MKRDELLMRLDRLEANLKLTNTSVQNVSEVVASTNTMVQALYKRLLELADDHGAEILELRKLNGRGRS